MSDHCPLTVTLDSTRMSIKLDGRWADATTQMTRRATRIRKGLQPEETQAVGEGNAGGRWGTRWLGAHN
eukprot:6927573-Pyramimonas_sp.AAC.1